MDFYYTVTPFLPQGSGVYGWLTVVRAREVAGGQVLHQFPRVRTAKRAHCLAKAWIARQKRVAAQAWRVCHEHG